MKPLKDLFMHELLSTGSPEPPTPTPSGNVITGNFKGTEDGERITKELQIPSNSYIKALFVFPTDGTAPNSTITTDSKTNIIAEYTIYKEYMDLTPTFGGLYADKATLMYTYKNGSSSYSSAFNRGQYAYNHYETTGTLTNCIRFTDYNKIQFYISNNNAGFLKDIDYTYMVYY